jgi:chromosome segregation ATPase
MAINSVVTFETVSTAVEALRKEGRRPTNRGIQEKLGGGSLSTIHGHLKKIKAQTPEFSINLDDLTRPVNEAVKSMVKKLYARAIEDKQDEWKNLEDDLEKSSKDLAASNSERDECLERIKELEASLNEYKFELKHTKGELEKENAEHKATKDELVKVRDEAADLRARLDELDKQLEKAKSEVATASAEASDAKMKLTKVKTILEERDRVSGNGGL